MHAFGTAAKKNSPFMEEEISSILLTTLMELKLKHPVTKQVYDRQSDISTLLAGFLDRCKEKGVPLNFRQGRKLGLQRHLRSNWETLDSYCKKVASPALIAFQKEHGAMTEEDVGNFDEAMVDLTDYGDKGNYLVLDCFGKNVVVPYEQSPHFTLKWGFIGRKLMVCMLIKIGNEATAPHPHHCQLMQADRYVQLAQSINGWTNTGLTTAFLELQVANPDVPIGPDAQGNIRPKVLNFDGHSAHIYNDDFKRVLQANKVLGLSPPAHTTAPSQRLPGTQQADASAANGGGIARFKKVFRPLMYKQFRAALERKERKGHVSVAEILAMVEMALKESWDANLAEHLNRTVGYYVNSDGFLDYDVLSAYRKDDGSCNIAAEASSSSAAGGAAAASGVGQRNMSVAREIRREQQEKVDVALGMARTEMVAAGVALAKQSQPPVPVPQIPVGRARKDAPNRYGMVVGLAESNEETALQSDAATKAAENKENRRENFWSKHRGDARKAEAALSNASNSPGQMAKAKGGVSLLKGIITSRMGSLPKAKNNKPLQEGGEGALLLEARKVVQAQGTTVATMTPVVAPGHRDRVLDGLGDEAGGPRNLNGDLDEEGVDEDQEAAEELEEEEEEAERPDGGGEAGCSGTKVFCENCEAEMVEEGTDYRFEGAFAWCNQCDWRVEDLESGAG